MRDLSPHAFDRTGRVRPNRSTVRLLCPKTQPMPTWRSCWFRHPMWCRRRGPRRRPRGLERVPGAWWCRIHRPTTPKRPLPPKTRRRKTKPLPLQRGEEKKGRSPQLGRPEGPRRGRPFYRTTPPMPKTAGSNGHPGSNPWQNRKCPDTRITYGAPLLFGIF